MRSLALTLLLLWKSVVSLRVLTNAKYIIIFDDDEVNIYDATNTEVTVLRGSVRRGWRLRDEGLWRIPLVANVQNENTGLHF